MQKIPHQMPMSPRSHTRVASQNTAAGATICRPRPIHSANAGFFKPCSTEVLMKRAT